jgi:hypothetical protein
MVKAIGNATDSAPPVTKPIKRIYETEWSLGSNGPYEKTLSEDERHTRIHYDFAGSLEVTDELERLIVKVVARLPKRVAEYAINRCLFLQGIPYGITLPGYIVTGRHGGKSRWVILFSYEFPEKDAESIIAHEIAHAWLKHDRYAVDIGVECEIDASNLAKQWGFSGLGANANAHPSVRLQRALAGKRRNNTKPPETHS